jgi:hypothetical protein
VSDEVFRLRLHDQITPEEADGIKEAAKASSCGDRPPVCE